MSTTKISTIGTQDGIEHADTLSQEGADLDTLRACSLPSNDWGTSSSEAWYFASRKHGFRDTDANRTAYCAAYEAAARKRCAELVTEDTLETMARDAANALLEQLDESVTLATHLARLEEAPGVWGEYDGSAADLRAAGLDPAEHQGAYHELVGREMAQALRDCLA